jgi:hypothetical protein
LLDLHRRSEPRRRYEVVEADFANSRLLGITKLDSVFQSFDREADAIASSDAATHIISFSMSAKG